MLDLLRNEKRSQKGHAKEGQPRQRSRLRQGSLSKSAQGNEKAQVVSNILDPVHSGLDPTVFDHPDDPEPRLKPIHDDWITNTIFHALEDNGYEGPERWGQLVLTGSLTTYQYADHSDVDVSLFVNEEQLPEWSRAEIFKILVGNVDLTRLPGTTHTMQCFIQAHGLKPTDLFKPGLRSAYDLKTDSWIVPPDKTRSHDVQREWNASYTLALETADKMARLLEYEPRAAVQMWHQIQRRRRRDQSAGKGDFSDSNIQYKELENRGLFPQISDVSGEHIA